MSSIIRLFARGSRQIASKPLNHGQQIVPKRTIVYTESGGIIEEPQRVRFGVLKVCVAVFSFLYVGATISKSGAAFLEDHDIFVPDDDDD